MPRAARRAFVLCRLCLCLCLPHSCMCMPPTSASASASAPAAAVAVGSVVVAVSRSLVAPSGSGVQLQTHTTTHMGTFNFDNFDNSPPPPPPTPLLAVSAEATRAWCCARAPGPRRFWDPNGEDSSKQMQGNAHVPVVSAREPHILQPSSYARDRNESSLKQFEGLLLVHLAPLRKLVKLVLNESIASPSKTQRGKTLPPTGI